MNPSMVLLIFLSFAGLSGVIGAQEICGYTISETDFLSRPLHFAFGDFDGDNHSDLVIGVREAGERGIYVLQGNGLGEFGTPVQELDESSYGIGVADFDEDGDLDIAAGGFEFRFMFNNNGSFQIEPSGFPSDTWLFPHPVDIDNDGDVDLVFFFQNLFTIGNGGLFHVWENNGGGDFSQAYSDGVTEEIISGAIADIDGDSDLDVVIANWFTENDLFGEVIVFRNTGPFQFVPEFIKTKKLAMES